MLDLGAALATLPPWGFLVQKPFNDSHRCLVYDFQIPISEPIRQLTYVMHEVVTENVPGLGASLYHVHIITFVSAYVGVAQELFEELVLLRMYSG